jgi:hypothetical protein
MLLEYARLLISFFGLGVLVFGGLQWRESIRATEVANEATKLAAYQRITGEWREHLRIFIEKPLLRPYFESKLALPPDEDKKEAILAIADVRLDTMDAILTYAALRRASRDIGGWRNTFRDAFSNSPVLCARLKETWNNYGLIREVASDCSPQISR